MLYHRYCRGDSQAYDDLMRRHDEKLLWYLYGILHNYQDAEDMVIEAFAWIMYKKPKIADGCFKAYLFQVGRRYAIRHKTRSRRADEFCLEGLTVEPTSEILIENEIIDAEKKQILHECLSRIDQTTAEALYLIYFEGLSYAEAAGVMKVNTKKIDNLVARGKQKLREELKKEGITNLFA